MLGPADFSILGGFPGDFGHSRITKAVETIAAAARNTGKHWSRTVGDLETASQALELGGRLLFHSADIVMIKNALTHMQAQFARLGFTFENRLQNAGYSYLAKCN